MARLMSLVLLLLAPMVFADQTANFYLVTYSPGANWDRSVAFDKQPGMKAHLDYLAGLHDDDIVLMEGPLVNRQAAVMLVRTGSMEQANRIVQQDPAVINKILSGSVEGWQVEMSSMRQYRRVIPDIKSPNEPFKVERRDPNAPINLNPDDSK